MSASAGRRLYVKPVLIKSVSLMKVVAVIDPPVSEPIT
jgi:hypothetical protein